MRCYRKRWAIVEGLGDGQGVAETLDLLGGAAILGADAVSARRILTRNRTLARDGRSRGLAASLMLGIMGDNSRSIPHTDSWRSFASARRRFGGEEGLASAGRSAGGPAECDALWGYWG